jgi:hypothetical protein
MPSGLVLIILETVARHCACVVMLDLHCDDLITGMFEHFRFKLLVTLGRSVLQILLAETYKVVTPQFDLCKLLNTWNMFLCFHKIEHLFPANGYSWCCQID